MEEEKVYVSLSFNECPKDRLDEVYEFATQMGLHFTLHVNDPYEAPECTCGVGDLDHAPNCPAKDE